jgi:hypothetical protein
MSVGVTRTPRKLGNTVVSKLISSFLAVASVRQLGTKDSSERQELSVSKRKSNYIGGSLTLISLLTRAVFFFDPSAARRLAVHSRQDNFITPLAKKNTP